MQPRAFTPLPGSRAQSFLKSAHPFIDSLTFSIILTQHQTEGYREAGEGDILSPSAIFLHIPCGHLQGHMNTRCTKAKFACSYLKCHFFPDPSTLSCFSMISSWFSFMILYGIITNYDFSITSVREFISSMCPPARGNNHEDRELIGFGHYSTLSAKQGTQNTHPINWVLLKLINNKYDRISFQTLPFARKFLVLLSLMPSMIRFLSIWLLFHITCIDLDSPPPPVSKYPMLLEFRGVAFLSPFSYVLLQSQVQSLKCLRERKIED